MKRVGLIVNPIAGMGGSIGLKGTDGDAYSRALELGADPVTPGRTRQFLGFLSGKKDIQLLVAPGKMGASLARDFEFEKVTIVGEVEDPTTPGDTKRVAREMVDAGVDLLVFCGGDGTARDILDAIGTDVAVIGIPAGVKMFSAIFPLNPRAAADMLDDFLRGTELVEKEVLDINEAAFRDNRLDSTMYGYLKVPKVKGKLQGGKQASRVSRSASEDKQHIAARVIDQMAADELYLLGPGTTVKSISNQLGVESALLGVDAVVNKELVTTDLNEQGILALLDEYHAAKIVVSPIGGQGFIFGRGNKQFTPAVLRRVGRDNIIVVSTNEKLRGISHLRVDTGDPDLDQELSGFTKVVVGRNEELLIEVES
ncbi:MAG: ATP-NAD kinase family protein [Promethearchaeota archaeon]